MDAWETLTGNSTLPSGDAWEHFNNQQAGGGGGETVFLLGPATAECNTIATAQVMAALSANVNNEQLTANINKTLSATVTGGTATCEA